MLRRGFANYCYSKGIPIYDIAIAMGHSNINTTTSYLNKSSKDVNLTKIFI